VASTLAKLRSLRQRENRRNEWVFMAVVGNPKLGGKAPTGSGYHRIAHQVLAKEKPMPKMGRAPGSWGLFLGT
jgi:hypothetical protein